MPRPFNKDLQVKTFPKKSEIRKLQHQCSMISEGWAVEVGMLYGYKGKRRSIQCNVHLGFNMTRSAAHTHRIMETARYYVNNQQEAVRKIRKMVKEHPDWYQW